MPRRRAAATATASNRDALGLQAIDAIPELADVDKLSRRWSLKPDTLRSWARSGLLPSVKLGAKTMFDVRDLAAFLERAKNGK